MKQLHVPVPETLTASYLIPRQTAMTNAEVRRRTIKAVETQVRRVWLLSGPRCRRRAEGGMAARGGWVTGRFPRAGRRGIGDCSLPVGRARAI